MAYSNGTITRAEQVDQGDGEDTIASKLRNSKTYQMVMDNEADGDPGRTGGSLVETVLADVGAGAVYLVSCCLDLAAAADQYWLCVVDTSSEPTTGDAILEAWPVYKGGGTVMKWKTGLPVSQGVGICLSTTLTTVTLPGDSSARFSWNSDSLG